MSTSKSVSEGSSTSRTLVMVLDVSTEILVQSVDFAEDFGTLESILTSLSLLGANVKKCKSQ